MVEEGIAYAVEILELTQDRFTLKETSYRSVSAELIVTWSCTREGNNSRRRRPSGTRIRQRWINVYVPANSRVEMVR